MLLAMTMTYQYLTTNILVLAGELCSCSAETLAGNAGSRSADASGVERNPEMAMMLTVDAGDRSTMAPR